jgi:hypothetical protein
MDMKIHKSTSWRGGGVRSTSVIVPTPFIGQLLGGINGARIAIARPYPLTRHLDGEEDGVENGSVGSMVDETNAWPMLVFCKRVINNSLLS